MSPGEDDNDMMEPGMEGEPGCGSIGESQVLSPGGPPHMQQPGEQQAPTAAFSQMALQQRDAAAAANPASSSASLRPYVRPAGWPQPTLTSFLLSSSLNALLAEFLPTRDLFHLQFLSRGCFTLLNSSAALLQRYYTTLYLSSFIPFLVDDAFLRAFLTPTYLSLPDGGTAVRNTYSMHVRHMLLNFCTRISDASLHLIAQHVGERLLSIDLEGGGRARISEGGMATLFASCRNLTSVCLDGCYQLNMERTVASMMQHCAHSLTSLSLNGCAQLNASAQGMLCQARLRTLHLNSCPLTDASLQQLAAAFKDQLTTLHMSYCGAVTDRGLAALVHYCRELRDLNLYGCTGLSRHALSYLRLCPQLTAVDISRIHTLDDGSIAEWVLPTDALQQQQAMLRHMVTQQQQGLGGGAAHASTHPDLNANLPQIFAAQQQSARLEARQHAASLLTRVSLDTCSRVSLLGLKVLLENCPSLRSLNAFGVANLSLLGLQSLLRITIARRLPLRSLEIGGGGAHALHPHEMDTLRREYKHIAF